jgi:hypothetical protein
VRLAGVLDRQRMQTQRVRQFFKITWARVVQMDPAELAFPHPLQAVQHRRTATIDLSEVHLLGLAR